MKWVTYDHVHMDRVASSWLIRRRVDSDAQFSFVPAGRNGAWSSDATPFGIPGCELCANDLICSTFRVIVAKFELTDPALDRLADIIESGIGFVKGKRDRSQVLKLACVEGVGLDAISEGMLYLANGDAENIEHSLVLYDALYLICRARQMSEVEPGLLKLRTPERWDTIKARMKADTHSVDANLRGDGN